MEELVGEIWDEKDPVEAEELIEHAEGVYELDGDVQATELAELLGLHESVLDDIVSSTVSGLTTELYGAFPSEGDSVTFENATVKVLQTDGLRVDRVLVTQEEEDPEEDE